VVQRQNGGGTSRTAELLQRRVSPFTKEVVVVRLLEKFKILNIPTYTGSGDLVEHLDNF
jgi:hypothetical protein